MLLAHPSMPPRNLREFIAFAKKHPGAINYSSASAGTLSHLVTELLKDAAGIKLVHVPYKGSGAATTALVSGEAQFSALVLPNALPMLRAGRVKAYAITAPFSGRPMSRPRPKRGCRISRRHRGSGCACRRAPPRPSSAG
jgi:tripartite-type tricarboxylate transporter receptor subunit TctC